MKTLLLALLVLCLAGSAPVRAAEREATAEDMLRAVFSAHPTYKGIKTVMFWTKRGADAVICKTWRQGDTTRFDYVPSPHSPGRVVVQDKKSIRYYQPAKKLLISEERPEDEDLRMVDVAFANYEWDIEGDAIIAGHDTKILKTVQKTAGTIQQRLWIDTKHGVILRKESYNIRGEIYFTSYFTEIEYPDQLDPQLFTLNMPSDTKEVIKTLPVKVDSPDDLPRNLRFVPVLRDSLPGGYQRLTMQIETLTGHKALRQTFSDGLDIVSLVELPSTVFQKKGTNTKDVAALGRNLEFQALLEGNLLQWRDDHIFYTLVGSLPQDEMLSMYNDIMQQQVAAGPTPTPTPNRSLMFYFWRGLDRIGHLGH